MDGALIEMLVLAASLLGAGLVAGLLAGLLGVGGGSVLVPVLYYVFTILSVSIDVRMHMAVGTSLGSMIVTSIRSARSHYQLGGVDVALFKRWIPFTLIGAAAGIAVAALVKGPVLTAIFAILAIMSGLYVGFGKESWQIASELPGRIGQAIMAFFISSFSVMMGIGGGTFTVPGLSLFGFPIHRAVGTAAAVGVLIAIPGAIGFALSGIGVPGRPEWSLGYASVIGVALIVPATLLAAPWGARLAHRLPRVWLRRAFAAFLLITGGQMGLNLL